MFKISMMLSQNVVGAIFETEHIHLPFSPMLWNTRCRGISDGVLSLANTLNRGSYLVIDQTAYCSLSWTWWGVITPCSNSESNQSQNSIKCLSLLINFPLPSLPLSFLLSLGVMVTSLRKKLAALPSPWSLRRPMTSVPQSRLCTIFSELAFSLSAVKLSGTLYFLILASAGLFL